VTQVDNRDYEFCVGTRRASRKGRFSGRGYLTRSAGDELRSRKIWSGCATGSRSPARAHHKGGPPGPLHAIGAAGPWDPPRHRPAIAALRSAAVPGRRHHPSRFVISQCVTAQSMLSRPRPSAPHRRYADPSPHHAVGAASCGPSRRPWGPLPAPRPAVTVPWTAANLCNKSSHFRPDL
jgi:hypothetical protein